MGPQFVFIHWFKIKTLSLPDQASWVTAFLNHNSHNPQFIIQSVTLSVEPTLIYLWHVLMYCLLERCITVFFFIKFFRGNSEIMQILPLNCYKRTSGLMFLLIVVANHTLFLVSRKFCPQTILPTYLNVIKLFVNVYY